MLQKCLYLFLLHRKVSNQEVFSPEGSSHELTDPLVLVEVLTGRVGDVEVFGL